MATTTGIVQKLILDESSICAQIGPSLNNSEVFAVKITSASDAASIAFQTSMIDALVAALMFRHIVTVEHADNQPFITQMTINSV